MMDATCSTTSRVRLRGDRDYDRSVPLDPQAVAYLEQLSTLGAPRPSEALIEQARNGYEEGASGLFGPAGDVESVEHVDADGVPVRIYHPSPGEPAALMYCHGGGWVLGSLDSHDPLCRTLAARSSCTVIAVDYRLAPEHPYPAVDDACAATRGAAARFSPLAIAGDSAGGQIAAAVALRARDAGLVLALQALIYPATNYAFDTESYRENADGMMLTTELMRWFWSQYVQDETRAGEPDCSPLRARELAGLAPALILTAEYDPLRDDGEAYARRLGQAGVPVTLRRYAGQIHGFIRMPALIDRANHAITEVAAAVRQAITNPPA
jgi:acetyl esterase